MSKDPFGFHREGWNETDLEECGLRDVLTSFRILDYEISSCRRGSYAKFGDTVSDLIKHLVELKADVEGVIEDLEREAGLSDEWYRIDDTGYALCMTSEQFESFCKDGGWKGSKDFFDDVGITKGQLLGKWFIVVGGRVHIK
jgi:hypothetical protein